MLAIWTLCWLLAAARETDAALALADAGKTDCVIVVGKDAIDPERYAASELARYLHEISGADFPVRVAGDALPPGSKTILVGPGAAGDVIPPGEIEQLGAEGYIQRTRGAVLAIAGGRPRGTLYGVYSFLEDQLGCRWLAPDVTRLVRRPRIDVAALDCKFVPRLEYRSTDYPTARDGNWAVRNKLNGHNAALDERRGGKVAYGPFVHTFDSILNPAQHFDQHPDYFSEVNGKRVRNRTQLCLTNPDVLRITIDTVRKWMREHPSATIFSISQNDWYNYCTCSNCAKVAAEEGSQIGPYLRFVNAVADAVRDEFPDKVIDTLAYQFTRKPPTQTVPRPNVIVRLCSIECCFSHPLSVDEKTDPENAAFARDLAAWSKLTNRLYIWDYVIDYRHSFAPFPNLYTLKPNINFFAEHGVKGIYEEANYFSRAGELAELRSWIIAKTLWDPSYDTDRAIDEFLAGYYEEAAGPIRKYINLIHDKTRKEGRHAHIFDGLKSTLVSPEVIEQANCLFAEAEKAVCDKPTVLDRVKVASLPIRFIQVSRLMAEVAKGGPMVDEQRKTLRALAESFDAVAKKAGVTHVAEHRGYADWIGGVRKTSELPPAK